MTLEEAKSLKKGDIIESFDGQEYFGGEVIKVDDAEILINWEDGLKGNLPLDEKSLPFTKDCLSVMKLIK